MNIYQVNTAVWLHGLSQKYERHISLDSVPEAEWDALKDRGCDAVWLMGVWQRSPAAIAINKADIGFVDAMKQVLPDFDFDQDVIGSAYSIKDYTVDPHFGDNQSLAAAKQALKDRGLKLIVDYVPNHVAPDNPWAVEHPEYFVQGSLQDLQENPSEFVQAGSVVLAKGRDPEFPAWSDVVQINAFSPELRHKVVDLLRQIAEHADGVRCDMAMLLIDDIFKKTWGNRIDDKLPVEFWAQVISEVKQTHPDFMFIAETYWDTEPKLLELGFDYCYDKLFYDYLIEDDVVALQKHLAQPPEYLSRLVRFIENHDEPRAASAFDPVKHKAAAALLATMPGAHMYHNGQFEGYKVRIPAQLVRGPVETVDESLKSYYNSLIKVTSDMNLASRNWQPLNTRDNTSLAYLWQGDHEQYLTAVNWSNQELHVDIEVPNQFSESELIFSSSEHNTITSQQEALISLDKLCAWQAVIIKLN